MKEEVTVSSCLLSFQKMLAEKDKERQQWSSSLRDYHFVYKQISENYKYYLSFSLSMWLKRHVNWKALYCNWKRERESYSSEWVREAGWHLKRWGHHFCTDMFMTGKRLSVGGRWLGITSLGFDALRGRVFRYT
jgi:hypothetical protein